jgi:hypothetical protein
MKQLEQMKRSPKLLPKKHLGMPNLNCLKRMKLLKSLTYRRRRRGRVERANRAVMLLYHHRFQILHSLRPLS